MLALVVVVRMLVLAWIIVLPSQRLLLLSTSLFYLLVGAVTVYQAFLVGALLINSLNAIVLLSCAC